MHFIINEVSVPHSCISYPPQMALILYFLSCLPKISGHVKLSDSLEVLSCKKRGLKFKVRFVCSWDTPLFYSSSAPLPPCVTQRSGYWWEQFPHYVELTHSQRVKTDSESRTRTRTCSCRRNGALQTQYCFKHIIHIHIHTTVRVYVLTLGNRTEGSR